MRVLDGYCCYDRITEIPIQLEHQLFRKQQIKNRKKEKKNLEQLFRKQQIKNRKKKKIRATTLSDQQQINNNKKIRTTTDQDPLAD